VKDPPDICTISMRANPPPPVAIVIDNDFVSLPASLVAFTVKPDVPSAVGVPEIVPFGARLKSAGNAPLSRLHVMGFSPLAASVRLYAVPTLPPGNDAVVIVGAAVAIVIDNGLVAFPAALAALTVKSDFPAVVGVPEIAPLSARLNPAGNVPTLTLHVTGASPLAVNV
jgi:hypothetical protein